jgi:hypothetical protein
MLIAIVIGISPIYRITDGRLPVAPRPRRHVDLKIRFKLRDVYDIEPWGKVGNQRLSWFGLSDGCYCIDTAAGRLLEHTGAIDPKLGEPWCDYQVGRLFEDLMEIWPIVSDPVPDDIVTRYLVWEAREVSRTDGGDVNFLDAWQKAAFWWRERQLDFGYLFVKPQLHLWRAGAEIHLTWDTAAPWLPSSARLTDPFETVRDAVARFFRDFLEGMGERVAAIKRDGWRREDCTLDIPRLVHEQREREEAAASALSQVRKTDWELAGRRLKELGA